MGTPEIIKIFYQQHKDFPKVPYAICNICQKEDPEKGKVSLHKSLSTTNLRRHIEKFHPSAWIEPANTMEQENTDNEI